MHGVPLTEFRNKVASAGSQLAIALTGPREARVVNPEFFEADAKAFNANPASLPWHYLLNDDRLQLVLRASAEGRVGRDAADLLQSGEHFDPLRALLPCQHPWPRTRLPGGPLNRAGGQMDEEGRFVDDVVVTYDGPNGGRAFFFLADPSASFDWGTLLGRHFPLLRINQPQPDELECSVPRGMSAVEALRVHCTRVWANGPAPGASGPLAALLGAPAAGQTLVRPRDEGGWDWTEVSDRPAEEALRTGAAAVTFRAHGPEAGTLTITPDDGTSTTTFHLVPDGTGCLRLELDWEWRQRVQRRLLTWDVPLFLRPGAPMAQSLERVLTDLRGKGGAAPHLGFTGLALREANLPVQLNWVVWMLHVLEDQDVDTNHLVALKAWLYSLDAGPSTPQGPVQRLHLLLAGAPACGKSHVLMTVLAAMLPPSMFVPVGHASEHAWKGAVNPCPDWGSYVVRVEDEANPVAWGQTARAGGRRGAADATVQKSAINQKSSMTQVSQLNHVLALEPMRHTKTIETNCDVVHLAATNVAAVERGIESRVSLDYVPCPTRRADALLRARPASERHAPTALAQLEVVRGMAAHALVLRTLQYAGVLAQPPEGPLNASFEALGAGYREVLGADPPTVWGERFRVHAQHLVRNIVAAHAVSAVRYAPYSPLLGMPAAQRPALAGEFGFFANMEPFLVPGEATCDFALSLMEQRFFPLPLVRTAVAIAQKLRERMEDKRKAAAGDRPAGAAPPVPPSAYMAGGSWVDADPAQRQQAAHLAATEAAAAGDAAKARQAAGEAFYWARRAAFPGWEPWPVAAAKPAWEAADIRAQEAEQDPEAPRDAVLRQELEACAAAAEALSGTPGAWKEPWHSQRAGQPFPAGLAPSGMDADKSTEYAVLEEVVADSEEDARRVLAGMLVVTEGTGGGVRMAAEFVTEALHQLASMRVGLRLAGEGRHTGPALETLLVGREAGRGGSGRYQIVVAKRVLDAAVGDMLSAQVLLTMGRPANVALGMRVWARPMAGTNCIYPHLCATTELAHSRTCASTRPQPAGEERHKIFRYWAGLALRAPLEHWAVPVDGVPADFPGACTCVKPPPRASQRPLRRDADWRAAAEDRALGATQEEAVTASPLLSAEEVAFREFHSRVRCVPEQGGAGECPSLFNVTQSGMRRYSSAAAAWHPSLGAAIMEAHQRSYWGSPDALPEAFGAPANYPRSYMTVDEGNARVLSEAQAAAAASSAADEVEPPVVRLTGLKRSAERAAFRVDKVAGAGAPRRRREAGRTT